MKKENSVTESGGGGWIVDRQLQTTDGVLNVDENPLLAAAAMHGERMTDGGLHQEAV